MKQTSKPTRAQRQIIEGAGLDTYTTRVIKETKEALECLLSDGSITIIDKEER